MIRNVADLLRKFVEQERKMLDEVDLTHGPTIGAMYEGLTKSLLEKSIPPDLELKVVSGFAFLDKELSGEIDCMVVHGDGEKIPYTDKYKWHIKNVIAVFEVKKTLSAAEISDSYDHLRKISKLYSTYLESNEAASEKFNLSLPRRVFAQMTGLVPPPHEKIESLPFDKEMIYHTLVCEHVSPIRIVVGHHGWQKEKTLRDHIYKLLEERTGNPAGMGAGSFPQLIIGGEFSIVKLNGLPYVGTLIDGMWPLLASTSHNPLRVLLELLFTKLDFMFFTNLASDDSTEQEAMSSCLRAKAIKREQTQGWEYAYDDLSSKALKDRGANTHWAPTELTSAQFAVVNLLCKGNEIDINDPKFVEFANQEPEGHIAFVESLTKTRLIAIDRSKLQLTTIQCQAMITPDGKYIAGENNAGQMNIWLSGIIGKPENQWQVLDLRNEK